VNDLCNEAKNAKHPSGVPDGDQALGMLNAEAAKILRATSRPECLLRLDRATIMAGALVAMDVLDLMEATSVLSDAAVRWDVAPKEILRTIRQFSRRAIRRSERIAFRRDQW
jgi:hypothetical protein